MDQAAQRESAPRHPGGIPPRVSIGLPVYNGEPYLVASVDSLLAQTFTDFELVICDNGSTDRTESICRGYEGRDDRVRYVRNSRNLGVFGNHAKVLSLATGDYFMWGAHDDIRAPRYLERCVQVLDAEPEVVICYTATQVIDERGEAVDAVETWLDCANPDPVARFADLIRMDHRLEPIMGLHRGSALRATGPPGLYPDSDRVLLAEMGLRGPFRRIDEVLFQRRDHAARSIRAHPSRPERAMWINPGKRTRLAFPYHRQLLEYLRSIFKVDLAPAQRAACLRLMWRWAVRHRRQLVADYDWSLRVMLGPLRPIVRRVRQLRSGHVGGERPR